MKHNAASYELHLRNANLSLAEIELIAQGIKTVNDKGGPSLQSFSMSYNDKLGDNGVLSLVNALPASVTEVGLVNCGIGDQAGDALINSVLLSMQGS